MTSPRLSRLLLALAAATLIGVTTSPPSQAAYKFCAFRSGNKGPCTCKSENDGPGQWTEVSRSLCQRTAKPPTPAAEVPVTTEPTEPPDPNALAAEEKNIVEQAPSAPRPAGEPITTSSIAKVAGGKLAEVRTRGKLICGVNTGLAGFSHQSNTGEWAGIDADFCRAVAAAVLGDTSKIEFLPLDASTRFDALQSGKIDLLSRNTTWNMNRDVELGLEFAGVLYLDGQSFITSAERGLVSAQQLSGHKVCVERDTTSEKNVAYYFKAQKIEAEIVPFPSRSELVKAYLEGKCDAYTGDRSSLFADRAGFPEPLNHAVLPEVISKEPLGPAVTDSDRDWVEVTRWVLAGLINAEEVGLDKATATDKTHALSQDADRLVTGAGASGAKLGLSQTWLRDAVAASGNYGEVFEANLGKSSPLGMDRGVNALWSQGGLLYAPPMW